jgi:DNA sulfur modification protein DndD
LRIAALGLVNFKSFHGGHRLVFPDGGPSRRVYLVGGTNGAGKTTLAQAAALALHGERAAGLPGLFAPGRDARKRYQRWLSAAFNREAHAIGDDQMKAWLNLADDSAELTITRSWWFDAAGDFVEEQIEVRENVRNGATALFVGDEAQVLIDQVLPRHLLDFAIFDGEQVRRLDDTLSASAVRSALDRLLDLDAVERTRVEIERLARERRLARADPAQILDYEQLRSEYEVKSTERATAVDQLRDVEDSLERTQRELDQLAIAFDAALASTSSAGQLSADLVGFRERRRGLRSRLGRHLGEWLYLLPALGGLPALVDDVADQRSQRSGREQLKLALESVESMTERMAADKLLRRRIGSAAMRNVASWFNAAIDEGRRDLDTAVVDGERSFLSEFSDAELTEVEAAAVWTHDLTDIRELAADLVRVDRRIGEMEKMLASADNDSATAQMLRHRDDLNVLLGEQHAMAEQARTLVDGLDGILASLRVQIARLEQRLSVTAGDQKWFETADATVAALDEFLAQARAGASLAVRNRMVTNLRVLLRKENLVHDVQIDPVSHVTRLIGPEGADVELPSSGEHQLAAMAFTDAVLAASENPLPIFIDTPLARLDSKHRRAVVRDFWPNLGRQVVVLSTDEEVVDDLLVCAEPSVAATFRVECDRDGHSSVTSNEYIQEVGS